MTLGTRSAVVAVPGRPQEPCFEKLKPGPGLPGDEVIANQRSRLCRAMVELVSAGGYKEVTVRGLSRLAGVSTKTFYAHFGNVEECFVATYESIMQDVLLGSAESAEQPIRACVRSLFRAFAEDRKAAHLVLVEPLAVGPSAVARAEDAMRDLRRVLGKSLASGSPAIVLPPRILQGVLAAACHVLRTRLLTADAACLQVADEFTDWILSLQAGRFADERWTGPLEELAVRAEQDSNTFGDDRRRLLAAVVKLSAKVSYRELRIAEIRREAGVSRRSFDAKFGSVEACFLDAVEAQLDTAGRTAAREAAIAPTWERGVVRAAVIFCVEIARDPALSRLGFLELFAPGPAAVERLDGIVADWGRRFFDSCPAHAGFSPLAAEASMVVAWRIARAEIIAGPACHFPTAAASIAFALLAPAVGAELAADSVRAELRCVATARPS